MDIFALANESMEIQNKEKEEQLAQEEKEKEQKKFKLDIKEAMLAVANKDYGWFDRLGENQKHFQPFMLNMWLAKISSKNKSRKRNVEDEVYDHLLASFNDKFNKNIFSAPKEMLWLLACSANSYEFPNGFNMNWIKNINKEKSAKYNKNVISYIADELWTSKTKIMEMIDVGLITAEDMKSIEKDLDTLEPKKKK